MNAVPQGGAKLLIGWILWTERRELLAQPITDCPRIEDPLASRAPPFIAGCDYNNRKIVGGVRTLFTRASIAAAWM